MPAAGITTQDTEETGVAPEATRGAVFSGWHCAEIYTGVFAPKLKLWLYNETSTR